MKEILFVDALIDTIKNVHPGSVVLRSNDQKTLGIPDLLAWIKIAGPVGKPQPWTIAIEAKSLHPLMENPLHRGRRTGEMLKHPFTGPQISLLRQLKSVGVTAFGLVRASDDAAFRIEPNDLPARTGNFTHDELVAIGTLIHRRKDGAWVFWSG